MWFVQALWQQLADQDGRLSCTAHLSMLRASRRPLRRKLVMPHSSNLHHAHNIETDVCLCAVPRSPAGGAAGCRWSPPCSAASPGRAPAALWPLSWSAGGQWPRRWPSATDGSHTGVLTLVSDARFTTNTPSLLNKNHTSTVKSGGTSNKLVPSSASRPVPTWLHNG